MAKVKYFDFEKNLWGEKRPLKEPLVFPSGTRWTVSSTDFKELDLSDRQYDSFCDFLSSSRPHVALLHSPASFILRIKSNKNVRKHYALVETRNAEDSVALVLAEAPVEVLSELKDPKSLKFLSVFTIGSPKGASLSVILAAAESGITQRTAEALLPLKATIDSDVTLFACNFIHPNHHHRESLGIREVCKNAHFVDVLEKTHDRGENNSTWSLWMRAARYDVEQANATGRRGEARQTLLYLVPRAASQSPQQQQSMIDIPMSRNTKATVKTSGGTAVLTDPAVLSAERSGKNLPPELYMLINQRKNNPTSRWKLDQCFAIKLPDGKLNSYEIAFDLSRFYNSPTEAVESLNHVKDWPLDYCVVNQVVLYAEGVHSPDRQAFRRYAKDHQKVASNLLAAFASNSNGSGSAAPNAAIAVSWQQAQQQQQQVQQQLAPQQAPAQRVSPGSSEYALFARAARQHPNDNPREWSESSSIIIYQTTPREMKFNITHRVPLTKDALRQTILYLNRHPSIPQDQNPLYDYPFDYALLQSVEHQGFWLIAAKNVPCDIVACRMVV